MSNHHLDTGNPVVSVAMTIVSGTVTLVVGYTNLIPHSLQDIAYSVAILSGCFSIANVVYGWRKKRH